MPQTEEQTINLSLEQKENYVDELLVFMKNKLEEKGVSLKAFTFDFHLSCGYLNESNEKHKEGVDLSDFKNITPIEDRDFQSVMNYCFTNQYVKRLYMGKIKFDNVMLTESGFARAKSVLGAKHKKPTVDNAPNISIGVVSGDNVQIGNNNIQNVTNTFQYLIKEISESEANDEEKKNALSKLKDFVCNPVVSKILSSGVVEAIKKLLEVWNIGR